MKEHFYKKWVVPAVDSAVSFLNKTLTIPSEEEENFLSLCSQMKYLLSVLHPLNCALWWLLKVVPYG